jgi:hypothetical protein
VGWLPEPVFRALVRGLPEVESRRHASIAQLAWLVHSAFGKSKTRVTDWLPAFAQVSHRAGGVRDLPPGLREDVRVGAAGRWLRQELLDAVLAASEE